MKQQTTTRSNPQWLNQHDRLLYPGPVLTLLEQTGALGLDKEQLNSLRRVVPTESEKLSKAKQQQLQYRLAEEAEAALARYHQLRAVAVRVFSGRRSGLMSQ